MRDVELWEAVALSLNLEPDKLPVYLGAFERFGDDPFRICPQKFLDRLQVANSNCGISLGFRPVHKLKARCLVDLPAFGAWAVKLNIPNMPPELLAMAETKPVVPTEPQATIPSPAPVVVASASSSVETDKAGLMMKAQAQGNSTKAPRKDSIDPVIELAQTKCRDPKDTNQVWPQMQVLADNEHAPFLASTAKGLKYHKSGKDAYFTRDALDKRLHPEKRKAPADRR